MLCGHSFQKNHFDAKVSGLEQEMDFMITWLYFSSLLF